MARTLAPRLPLDSPDAPQKGYVRPQNNFAPQARGKAAAFDALYAQGGSVTNDSRDPSLQQRGRSAGLPLGYKRTRGGQVTNKGQVVKGDMGKPGQRFTEGRLAGKTYDQAKQGFEQQWAGASDEVKNKYARKAESDLAPSERPTAPAAPQKPAAPAGVAQAKPKELQGPPRSAMSQPAPGSDEARAAALTDSSRDERFATADTGDGGMKSAIAKQNFDDQRKALTEDAAANPPTDAQKSPPNNYTPSPSLPVTPKKTAPAADMGPNLGYFAGKVGGAIADTAGGFVKQTIPSGPERTPQLPVSPGVNPAVEKAFPGVQDPNYKAPAPAAPRKMPADQNAAIEQAFPGVQAKVTAAQAPPQNANQTPAPSPAPLAADPKINKLTGLPLGFRPGDTVQPGQKMLADASVKRQQDATNEAATLAAAPKATAVAPMRGPASRQDATGSSLDDPNNAFSKQAYARTDAAMQQGVDTSSIRAGTASQATKGKYPDLVKQIDDDTQAMSGMTTKPVAGTTSRVASSRPATAADRKRILPLS